MPRCSPPASESPSRGARGHLDQYPDPGHAHLAVEIENIKLAIAGSGGDALIDEKSQRALDVQAALSELGAAYEERRAQDPDLTPAADWLPPKR